MKLAEFAAWCLQEGPFDGCDLDGGSVQDRALKCGLIVKTKFDPAIHGDNAVAEPGDEWFVYSGEFQAALAQEQ